MLKKLALAAVAASLIAGPALAAPMTAPATKTAAASHQATSKMSPIKAKQKVHNKMKKSVAPYVAH